MSEAASDSGADSPFSSRAALVLILFGALVFVALLYMIGSGATGGSTNDGGGHAGGKGLNGYAAFAGFIERRGYAVRRVRDPAVLDDPGLLVLTPPASADGREIDKIVRARRASGPTMVITPKWSAVSVPAGASGAKRGWVTLNGIAPPEWRGFLDDVGVRIGPMNGGKAARWSGGGLEGPLPDAWQVQTGKGLSLVALVVGSQDGRILAAYVDDGGSYPALEAMAQRPISRGGEEGNGQALHPIIVVFEPDLLDNYGMANRAKAQLAERLVHAATGGAREVNFDLTLNGFARPPNLLTLPFEPPFLAPTL